MKYDLKLIKKSIFLAPIPLLVFMLFFLTSANPPYNLQSIGFWLIGIMIVYLIYCILVAPITFIISIILNYYSILNLFTILTSAFIVATPFYLLISFLHMGAIPAPWWQMYSHFSTILMTIVPAICYWICLKWFSLQKSKELHRLCQTNNTDHT